MQSQPEPYKPTGFLDPDAPDPPMANRWVWLTQEELKTLNEVDTTQLLLRRRLEAYAENRRWLDKNYNRTIDWALYKNLPTAIYKKTDIDFRYVFAKWFLNVDTNIRQWERKQAIEEFEKTGEKNGFWGSSFGVYAKDYFPEYCGATMTEPPPYLAVWGPKVRRSYENYEFHHYGRHLQHQAFWASVGFFGTIAVQFHAWTQYSLRSVVFKNWLARPFHPFFIATLFSIFPGSFTHVFGKRKRKLESMHHILTDTGFLGAKARLIADDIMWPEGYHNRDYLKALPRDEYDEFVWSVDDDDIAFGNFDRKEWDFVLDQTVYEPPTTYEKVRRYAYLWLGRPYDYKPPVQKQPPTTAEVKTESTE